MHASSASFIYISSLCVFSDSSLLVFIFYPSIFVISDYTTTYWNPIIIFSPFLVW